MNANELADALDNLGHNYTNQTEIAIKSAVMLRQQAEEIIELECDKERQREKYEGMLCDRDVEIEALKQIIDANNLIQNIGQFVKPQEKCPPTSWWKGDPTCGGITENYGLEKAQEK
jgi:hypothetical protein